MVIILTCINFTFNQCFVVRLKNYEEKLFTMKKRADMFEEMGLAGSWKPKFEELLLKGKLYVDFV